MKTFNPKINYDILIPTIEMEEVPNGGWVRVEVAEGMQQAIAELNTYIEDYDKKIKQFTDFMNKL